MNSTISSPSRPSRWLLTAAAALALVSGGCLNYENQIFVFHFPKDGKEIKALFVYDNVCVGRTDKETDAMCLKNAQEELTQLINGDMIIAGYPIFRIKLADLKNGPEVGKVFRRNLVVDKGQFVWANGKLSYCQPVTLKDPQIVLAAFNREISQNNSIGIYEIFAPRAAMPWTMKPAHGPEASQGRHTVGPAGRGPHLPHLARLDRVLSLGPVESGHGHRSIAVLRGHR